MIWTRFPVLYKSQRNTPHRCSTLKQLPPLFTNNSSQWDAIALAMKDYGDFHGGMDETIANNVQAKIAKIFELTAN